MASREFFRVFKDMIISHKPRIVGLFEPKVSSSQVDAICCKFVFDQWIRVEAVRFSGGIGSFKLMNLKWKLYLHIRSSFF